MFFYIKKNDKKLKVFLLGGIFFIEFHDGLRQEFYNSTS